MKAFDLITSRISHVRNAVSVYFPYSDWIIERWPNYFLPALDAFRVLGIAVDVLPYAPPLEESVYPYYPFHMNKDVLARLLKERTVLVLPNESGFQQTDSDLIKAFIEEGGAIVAFGPEIPMGRSYERNEIFGVDEGQETSTHRDVIVRDAIGNRAKTGSRFTPGELRLASWTANGARTIAAFEDGTPAITVNKFGRGTVITVLPDAATAAQKMPELIRDLVDYAVSLRGGTAVVDILGLNENSDIAVAQTSTGFRVAVVNYNASEMDVTLQPKALQTTSEWLDLVSNNRVGISHNLRLKVPAGGFRALEFRGR